MTTAERISARYGDDGQCWVDGDNVTIDDACAAERGVTIDERPGTSGTVRYTFSDGSVLTIAGDGWDLGFPGCYCWQGAGHDQVTCEADKVNAVARGEKR